MNIFFHSIFKTINVYILFTIFIASLCTINSEFRAAKYIKDFNKYKEFQEAFKNKTTNYGFLLIYSSYCPHCIIFSPNYITLSEVFHNDLFFYAAGMDHGKYRKEFNIRGYPTILFYNNGSYFEYNKNRGVDRVSKFIRDYVPNITCTEISYKNIRTVNDDVYKEKDRNIIIGFFNDEKKINSFREMSNSLINNYIDLCYYVIRNESTSERANRKFLDMKENEIWSNSRKKGENNFIFDEINYKKNLFEKVINIYENINSDKELYLFDKMKNKEFIVIVYDNDNIKNKYVDQINKLFDKSKENNNISIFLKYYFILYKNDIIFEKLKNLESNKIYYISSDFKKQTIIEDLNQFLNINIDDNNKLREKEKIINNITIINVSNRNININKNISDKINDKETISETIKEIKIEMKEENMTTNNTKNTKNIIKKESEVNDIQNIQIMDKEINLNIKEENSANNDTQKITKEKNLLNKIQNSETIIEQVKIDLKEENIPVNKTKRDFKHKRINQLIGGKHKISKDKNINVLKKEYLKKKMEKKEDNDLSNVLKLFALLVFIAIVAYFVVTRYLCVGFIKVDDNQVIEFNNQANKIEIV